MLQEKTLEREEVMLEMEKMTYLVNELRKKIKELQANIAQAEKKRKPVRPTAEKATQVGKCRTNY
jgi:hypothetical protein